MFTLIILTYLYDVPLQRDILPWHVILNRHAPMSESESEQKITPSQYSEAEKEMCIPQIKSYTI